MTTQPSVPTAAELAAMTDIAFAGVWYGTEARLVANPAPEHDELMELLAIHDVAVVEARRRVRARSPEYPFDYGRRAPTTSVATASSESATTNLAPCAAKSLVGGSAASAGERSQGTSTAPRSALSRKSGAV